MILGVHHGKPVLVAKKSHSQHWVLFRNAGQSDLKKENLKKLGNLPTVEDVLAYMQDKNLRPFCPQPETETKATQPPAEDSSYHNEKRRYFRKRVDLNGQYRNQRTGSSGEVLVEDVSFKGLKMTTIGPSDIKSGDRLTIEFTLDNPRKSRIRREALARHVDQNRIGIEFINPPAYDKELGFYLV